MAFKLGMTIEVSLAYMRMLVSMTLTLMKGHSGLAEEQIQHQIIPTTKQAVSLKLAATVGHDKFYFSLKSSVAFVLNDGHTSTSMAC